VTGAFPSLSLLRGFSSLFGRFNSLFARLGNSLRCLLEYERLGGDRCVPDRLEIDNFAVYSRPAAACRNPPDNLPSPWSASCLLSLTGVCFSAKYGHCQWRNCACVNLARTVLCGGAFVVLNSLFHCYSIVIRLLGLAKFVDRRKNSIDPPSNEFRIQPVDPVYIFSPKPADPGGKNAIFAVLASVSARRELKRTAAAAPWIANGS